MPANPVYEAYGTASDTSVAVDVIERASPDIFTTTTADPGAAGTAVAVTNRSVFPQSGTFKLRLEKEVVYVTGGTGTGAGSFTVLRGQDNTTAVAHAVGVVAALVVGVQRVEPVFAGKQLTFKGRTATFRIPGRAATAQNIFALFNAAGSPIIVDLQKITVDLAQTAAAGIAPTVIPPIIRAYKITAVPTNGTAATKVAEDSTLTSNANVTLWQDASADGTGSTTTLTSTPTAGNFIAEEFAPRILVVGTSASTFYEPFDRTTFMESDDEYQTLNAGEGALVRLDTAAVAGNPTTSMWIVGARWVEYTYA
jgi:hypothetical protein